MHEAGHQFCNHFIIPEYSPIQTSRPITSSPPLLSHTGDTSPEAASYTDITAQFWILSIHFISYHCVQQAFIFEIGLLSLPYRYEDVIYLRDT